MKKTTLILSLATLMCAGTAKADNYFFSVNGAGDMDGSSWENAAPSEYLGGLMADLKPGDAVYLQAGTYLPDRTTGRWDFPQGVTIKGGYGPDMTGTNTEITYPTATETILTADIDGDGKGDNADRAFIVIANELTDGWKGDKTWADYEKTTVAGITVRDALYTGTSTYKGAAVFAVHANVEFDNVKFIDNETTVGGGVVCCQGCHTVFRSCIWRDNKGTNAGVALLHRQHNGGTSADETRKGITMLDRCEFTNNTVADPTATDVARYGGALALADWGGTMWIVNSSVTGTDISWAGAMGRFGTGTTLYSLSNTFYDCNCGYEARHSGDIFSMGDQSHFYSINTIAVNKTDGREGMMATVFIQTDKCTFDTKGYNIWGSTFNNTTTPYAATDNINKDNTMEVVFGTNTATEAGGFNVIAPLETFRGVPRADLEAAAAAWEMPREIDITLDQTGKIRPDNTIPGCYDANSTTGIADITTAGEKTAADSDAVYNLQGIRVGSHADMGALPAGLYICGGKKYLVK